MALETETNRDTVIGNSLATSWPIPFNFWDRTEIKVTRVDLAGLEHPLQIDVDYGVTGGNGGKGTLTYPLVGSPLPGDGTPENSEQLIQLRILPLRQETRLKNQGPYFAEEVESTFDQNVARIQQQQEALDRAVKQALSGESDLTFPPYASGEVIGWDQLEEKLVNYVVAALGGVTLTAWSEDFLLSQDAAAARGKMGASAAVVETRAPTVNDDSLDGYRIFDRWLDTASGLEYQCRDATAGAAVWVRLGTTMPSLASYDLTGFVNGEAPLAGFLHRARTARALTFPVSGTDLGGSIETPTVSAPSGGSWGLELLAGANEGAMTVVADAVLPDGVASVGWTRRNGTGDIAVAAGEFLEVRVAAVTATTLPSDVGWLVAARYTP